MRYLDSEILTRLNPWYYCSAWLDRDVYATTRARHSTTSRRPYDPDKEIKAMLRYRMATQLFPDMVVEVPLGEVMLRIVTLHPLPHDVNIPADVVIDPSLFVGATQVSKDLDNIAKIYMDALNPRKESTNHSAANGILWRDDRQCCYLEPTKTYALNGGPTGVFIQAWYRKEPMLNTINRFFKGRNNHAYTEIIRDRCVETPRYSILETS